MEIVEFILRGNPSYSSNFRVFGFFNLLANKEIRATGFRYILILNTEVSYVL